MPDPTLSKSLNELAAVLKRLNEESDTLNARISEFEAALLALNPGIGSWWPKPIRLNETDGMGSQVAFFKWQEQWGLWVVRGKFVKSTTVWRMSTAGEKSVVRLVDATREERIAAVEIFPGIVEALTKEAKARLAAVEAANKQAQ